MKLQLNIPLKGSLKGTSGWLFQQLNSCNPQITNTEEGALCIVGTFDGVTRTLVYDARGDYESQRFSYPIGDYGKIKIIHPFCRNYLSDGAYLFQHPLTDKATDCLIAFLDLLAERLYEVIQNEK